jgi:hypothetical protein
MPRNIREWKSFGENPRPDEALKSGDLRAALGGFAMEHLLQSRFRDRDSDGPAIGFGGALWLLGDYYGAAMLWAKVCDEAYKGRYHYSSQGTFQSGLLLWFASLWLKDNDWHDDADQLLDKLLKKKQLVMGAIFPSLLAKLLRGEINLLQVEKGYSDTPLLRERQQTQALFYAGVRAMQDGKPLETERHWQQIKPPQNKAVDLEYYLLVHEREKLTKQS